MTTGPATTSTTGTAVALVGLDLEAPPASSEWEEAAQLVRFRSVSSGRVERCKLKGGMVHLGGGPWSVVDNEYLGSRPNTYNQGVFALLYPHDLTLSRNRAHDVGPSGKTWRFLVLAQRGYNDRVTDNVVDGGIGPRQGRPPPPPERPRADPDRSLSPPLRGEARLDQPRRPDPGDLRPPGWPGVDG